MYIPTMVYPTMDSVRRSLFLAALQEILQELVGDKSLEHFRNESARLGWIWRSSKCGRLKKTQQNALGFIDIFLSVYL